MNQLIKLSSDDPVAGNRWIIFPTRQLRSLFLRRTGSYDYVLGWKDAQGYGLHTVRHNMVRHYDMSDR